MKCDLTAEAKKSIYCDLYDFLNTTAACAQQVRRCVQQLIAYCAHAPLGTQVCYSNLVF